MARRAAIIGAGISGLTIAYRLKRDFNFDVTVFESESRTGGKAKTDKINGFICEQGTNSWLDNEPSARILLGDLGILDKIKPADPLAERRFIYTERRLREIKMNPVGFMTSSVLPFHGRLRLALEPFVKKRIADSDETLLEFAARRLGKSASEILIGPMASGVYAGDPTLMSLKSCFRKVYDLEQNYGGLVKGMAALKKQKRLKGEDPKAVSAGPSGRMTSLYGGLSDLVNALTFYLKDSIQTGCCVTQVKQSASAGFEIHIKDKPSFSTDIVVSAAPAWAASTYLAGLDEDAAKALGNIPYPSLDVVCLGFKRDQVRHSLNGFGFLVPRKQGKTILGSLWTSSIFPGRAPDDCVLISTMIGGMTEPQVGDWPKEQVLNTARADLADILGIAPEEKPVLTHIVRHDRAIPQYHVGHDELVKRIKAAQLRHEGFFISGNAMSGVGVIDCIRNSTSLAKEIALYAKS